MRWAQNLYLDAYTPFRYTAVLKSHENQEKILSFNLNDLPYPQIDFMKLFRGKDSLQCFRCFSGVLP